MRKSQGLHSNPFFVPMFLAHHFYAAADERRFDHLSDLITLYPTIYLQEASPLLLQLMLKGCPVSYLEKYWKLTSRNFDPFLDNCLRVARGEVIDIASVNDPRLEQQIYQIAYTYNNPYLYQKGSRDVGSDDYSLHFMWIHRGKVSSQQEFLIGDRFETDRQFFQPISKWARLHPTHLYIWVDLEFLPLEVLNRTKDHLKSILQERYNHIHFRNIRDFQIVKDEPELFSCETPLYFRVDLLRAAMIDQMILESDGRFIIYADLDMEPMSSEAIFDKRTCDFLQDFGIVMAKRGIASFENGFQIIDKNHQFLSQCHRDVVVDLSIELAKKSPQKITQEMIFDSYALLFVHLLDQMQIYGRLKKEVIDLDYKNRRELSIDFLQNLTLFSQVPFEEKTIRLCDVLPRKPVHLPPSKFVCKPKQDD